MYLKALEMCGFKSFAGKTRLEFEPGMTAIVGPNGCGKSNVSDAVRWVLGEQSAKALRGSKMEDCIFNGTDDRKPLGMAEVSIVLEDCEEALGTEYHEVEVTRRVFRSGEGQYFINRTPCRLKDIQRLFMDTGIGTTSYSLMEQGRIDRILSSRPEDRRDVFEEASGITRFKADKKEAIRKLEHTEANLLRLSDVIREVKRQIGSLQRQAGKARRYKELKGRLRSLDLFATRERLKNSDSNIADLETRIEKLHAQIQDFQNEVRDLDRGNATLRQSLVQTEREIGTVLEGGVRAKSNLDHTRELIRVNKTRIEEYRSWSDRDSRELDETDRLIEEKRTECEELETGLSQQRTAQESSRQEHDTANSAFEEHKHRIDSARSTVQRLREESVELESLGSRLQNQLVETETRERTTVLQRERLSAEKSQLTRVAAAYEKRQEEMSAVLERMTGEAATCEREFQALEKQAAQMISRMDEYRQQISDLKSTNAAGQARMELVGEESEAVDDFPSGARLLLDEPGSHGLDGKAILGSLASELDVEPHYRTALEAALRSWLDAVLVKNTDSALEILKFLESGKKGAARLLAVEMPGTDYSAVEVPGDRLLNHIRCADHLEPLARRFLDRVLVADSLTDIPRPVPPGFVYVTKRGSVIRADGSMEFWMAGSRISNPMTRKHKMEELKASLSQFEREIATASSEMEILSAELESIHVSRGHARRKLDDSSRALAQKEGENQIVAQEALEARQRLETVTWELDNLNADSESEESEKDSISARMNDVRNQRERLVAAISEQNKALHELESEHTDFQSDVTEKRIRLAEVIQKAENLSNRHEAAKSRLAELEGARNGRTQGILSYENSITSLEAETGQAESRLSDLERAVQENNTKAEGLRKNREKQSGELGKLESLLANKREELDDLHQRKSDLEVQIAEGRMRRQNMIDRVGSEYSVTLEQIMEVSKPVPGEEAPEAEAIETQIAELRTKLDAMGAVNLVAIEEYKELEERYAFLTNQEQDLVSSKQQLMDMIRKINRTTSEMFKSTFDQVNSNFLDMFKKLFNGGSAKLVLVNEEDVLECGIEIIARPPGKRLQNISLLSGGERTMTAVALLFAIYMIKPSPFCLLDELDAALDDSNIGRFVAVLKEFLLQSQFIVITHNRQTISAASVLYGVTMQEKGVSKIMSMKFHSDGGVLAATE